MPEGEKTQSRHVRVFSLEGAIVVWIERESKRKAAASGSPETKAELCKEPCLDFDFCRVGPAFTRAHPSLIAQRMSEPSSLFQGSGC